MMESELLYLRARYYEPETGRFLSRDTYEGNLQNPLSRHLYAYVGNNPVNLIDPTGHKVQTVEQVANNIARLEKLAKEYYSNNIWAQKSNVDNLIVNFIRNGHTYKDGNWDIVAGSINKYFVDFVNSRDKSLTDYFKDSIMMIDSGSRDHIDFHHLIYTLNAQMYTSDSFYAFIPGVEGIIDEWAGWAGDIQSCIGNLQRATKNSSNYEFHYKEAKQLIGSKDGLFRMSDMLADIDAVNIYFLNKASSSFTETFKSYYQNAAKQRYSSFVSNYGGIEKLESRVTYHIQKYAFNTQWKKVKHPLIEEYRDKNLPEPTQMQFNALQNAFLDFIKERMQ